MQKCKSDHTWLWSSLKKHHHHYKKRKKPHYKEPPKYSHHTVTRPLEVTPKPPTGYPPTFKFKKRRLPLHQLATKTVVKLGHSKKKKPYQVKWAKDFPFGISFWSKFLNLTSLSPFQRGSLKIRANTSASQSAKLWKLHYGICQNSRECPKIFLSLCDFTRSMRRPTTTTNLQLLTQNLPTSLHLHLQCRCINHRRFTNLPTTRWLNTTRGQNILTTRRNTSVTHQQQR